MAIADEDEFGHLLTQTELHYERELARLVFLGELELAETTARQVAIHVRALLPPAAGPQLLEKWVRYRYPLVFARWLVGLAGEVYTQGALWPYVAAQLERDTRVVQLLGPLFSDVLDRFKLRRFPGHRYVSSILGHSIVPESNLELLLRMIDKTRDKLPENVSAAGLWEALRRDPMLSTAPKPLQRFFNTADPAVGGEYVARLSQFMREPSSVEVPAAVHRAWYRFRMGSFRRPPLKARDNEPPVIRTDGIRAPLVVEVPQNTVPRPSWRVRCDDTVLDWAELAGQTWADGVWPVPNPCRTCMVLDGDVVRARAEPVVPGVWLFDENGRVWAHPWLTPGAYTVILARTWRVDGIHVQLRDKPWLGTWSEWMLVEIDCVAGSTLTITDADGGVRLRAGVVKRLHRHRADALYKIPLGCPLVVDYEGQVEALAPFSNDIIITPSVGGAQISLNQSFTGPGPYRLVIDSGLTEPGPYEVAVRNLFGEDTFQVIVHPPYALTASRLLRWPRPNGFHRSGSVTLTVPAGVMVSEWTSTGTASQYRHHVGRDISALDAVLQVDRHTFRETLTIRSVWWEWTSERLGLTVSNGPLHSTWEGLKAEAWRLRLWVDRGWDVELRLGDVRHVLKRWSGVPSPAPFVLDAMGWSDVIDSAVGEDFQLIAVPTQNSGEPAGAFLLAWIHRPVFQNVGVDVDQGIVRWRGPDPGPCMVSVRPETATDRGAASPRLGPEGWEMPVPAVQPLVPPVVVVLTSQRHNTGVTVPVIPLRPTSSASALPPVTVHRFEHLGDAVQRANQERSQAKALDELDRWTRRRGRTPRPETDRVRWVTTFLALPLERQRDAYREVVQPSLPRAIPEWITALLRQPTDLAEVAWVRLGVPQWPLGALVTQAALELLARWDDMACAAPLLAWLVLTSTEYSSADPTWRAVDRLATLLGRTTEGRLAALDLLEALDRNDPTDRGRVLTCLRSASEATLCQPDPTLLSVPVFCPTEPVVDPVTATWLEEKFTALSTAQGWLANAQRLWTDYSDSARALMRIAALQRARAYGLWPATAAEDERAYATANTCFDAAPHAYRQAVLRADLCVAVEHRIQLNEED
jgi:hypothetical protein